MNNPEGDALAAYERFAAEEQKPEVTQTTEPTVTPSGGEKSPEQKVEEAFEYFLGGKANKLPGTAEFALKHNGQIVKVPASKLINGYRQAEHLQSKISEYGKKAEEWGKSNQELEALRKQSEGLDTYKKLQEWSEKHPEAFQYLWDNLQKADAGVFVPGNAGANVDPNSAQSPYIQAFQKTIAKLNEQVSELSNWKSERQKEIEAQKLEADMKAVDTQASEFGQKFGINLDEKDESGLSLKSRIIKWGLDHNVLDFEPAALAFLKDTLFEKAKADGRSETVKSIKGDAAQGILSRSSTPPVGQSAKVDPKKVSWEELKNPALEMYERLASQNG